MKRVFQDRVSRASLCVSQTQKKNAECLTASCRHEYWMTSEWNCMPISIVYQTSSFFYFFAGRNPPNLYATLGSGVSSGRAITPKSEHMKQIEEIKEGKTADPADSIYKTLHAVHASVWESPSQKKERQDKELVKQKRQLKVRETD